MSKTENMITLKKYYPDEYHWLINAFAHYGFKYYADATKTKQSRDLWIFSINPKLPVFAHASDKPWLDDYVQFNHGDFDFSVGETTLRFYDIVKKIHKTLTHMLALDHAHA